MKTQKMKDMIVLSSSITVSMLAGFMIGCIKTKLMNNEDYCNKVM